MMLNFMSLTPTCIKNEDLKMKLKRKQLLHLLIEATTT